MAEIKVITVQAGEDFLKALTKLLGSDVAAQIDSAVKDAGVDTESESVEEPVDDECPCEECQGYDPDEEEVEEEEERVFGEVIEEDSDDFGTYRVYDVVGAGDLSVTVTPEGVKVHGVRFEEEDDTTFDSLFAPIGAWDEVTAVYNEPDGTLTVRLTDVDPDGVEVEIEGWEN